MVQIATTSQIEQAVNEARNAKAFGCPEDRYINMKNFYNYEGNIALHEDGSVLLFGYEAPGVYDIHFALLPEHSGKVGLDIARRMISEMFTNHGAHVIKGRPPRDNRAVRCFATRLGFQKTNDKDIIDSLGRLCPTYELRVEEWAAY